MSKSSSAGIASARGRGPFAARVAAAASAAALLLTLPASAGAATGAGAQGVARIIRHQVADGAGAACTWAIVPSPNVPGTDNQLTAVAMLSATDGWAVGFTGGFVLPQTIALHWNGSTWDPVQTPRTFEWMRFYAIAAVAPDDIWAAGDFYGDADEGALVEHWDGTAWTRFDAHSDGQILGLTALSSVDVWAVGSVGNGGYDRPFARHWNGKRWSSSRIPWHHQHGWLDAVSGSSAEDVWAAGQPNLTFHWNGTHWKEVPGAPADGAITFLNAVQDVASDDVWVIGDDGAHGFARRWRGEAWTVVPVPKARKATLNGAAALSTDDLWAVGSSTPEGEPRATATLAMRWDGSVWTIVSTPSPPGHHKATSTLAAVATAGGELTAVGSYRAHGYWNALIERCR